MKISGMSKHPHIKGQDRAFGNFLRHLLQKYTIMVVPHSEKKSVHFHVSLVALIFCVTLLGGILVGFFWFSLDFSGKSALLVSRSRDLAETEASLDIIRSEVGHLVSSTERFRTSLAKTMEILGINSQNDETTSSGDGDIATLFDMERSDASNLAEARDIQMLRTSLDNSTDSLNNIGSILANQKDLISDIPTIWPLKDVRGWVTQIFGPSIHPFGRYWYIHRGVDLASVYGVPIVATANGKVVKRDFDANGFGNYIDIQHNYGFKTRYAHLQRIMVDVGQRIAQGDVIATMGSSGLSTGPHLHYEVMIGTQLVDPIKFLNMTNADIPWENLSTNLKRYQ